MLRLFRARSPDKYRDNKGTQQEQVRTPQSDRTRVRRRRLGSLAESRLPACRWRQSLSSPRTGHWFLSFQDPERLSACVALHPSRPVAVPETRFPDLSSIEYCRPSAAPRLEIRPATGCSGPTAVLPQRPPALCLANSYCCSSTVEAELLPVGKSKRRAFAPGVDQGTARSARRENPTPAVRV